MSKIDALMSEVKEMLDQQYSIETLTAKQIEIEEETDAVAREIKEGKRLEEVFLRPTQDPKMQGIITAVFEGMRDSLHSMINSKSRGSGAKYLYILRALDLEVLVGTVLASSLPSLMFEDSIENSIQRLGSRIGKAIITEVKISQAESINPIYMKRVEEGLKRKRANNARTIKAVYDSAFDAVTLGSLKYDLTQADYIHIGKFGLQAMMDAGLIIVDKMICKRREWSVYKLEPSIRDYVLEFEPEMHRKEIGRNFKFMIVPPDDWEGFVGGGFKSNRRKINHPLVSLRYISRDVFKLYKNKCTPEKMPLVFKQVNYIQSIPFSISRDVVALIQQVYDIGGGIFGIPETNDPPAPEFPFAVDWDKETAPEHELKIFSAWKYQTSLWHEEILIRRSKIREITSFFHAIHEGIEKVYFPVFLDFRGRLYYNANPNPQGTDIARATLNFYNKKPLGADGLFWLKVHLANSLGYDKTRFKDRVKYVDSILEDLFKALESPLDHYGMFGTDNPLSAYITTLELKRAIESGDPESYLCGIPVHMDATVSGTQHFSALLRDEVGAEFTNLIDLGGDMKADLYTKVSDVALEDAKQWSMLVDYKDTAEKWINFGIARDLAKKPVMTYTYGVTKFTVQEHIHGYLSTNGTGGVEFTRADIAFATDRLFKGIAKTIPATVNGMKFLQDVAREVGHSAMNWTTPSGFFIHFNALTNERKRIRIKSAGVDLVWIQELGSTTQPQKMVSGVAPNFVHGNDASHLCLTSSLMKDSGFDMVCIHDSFGTHPCDVTQMHKHIRESFITMYTEDVLGNFVQEVGATLDLPLYGNFDLSNVRDSEFFFC